MARGTMALAFITGFLLVTRAIQTNVSRAEPEKAFKDFENLKEYGGVRLDGHLQKRGGIVNGERYRWQKGIVPYTLSSFYVGDQLERLQRAMYKFERATCIRFVPWTGSMTYRRYGLAHQGYLKFKIRDHFYSTIGLYRCGRGQYVSCAGENNCVHEIGHALGQQHEQMTWDPDRFWSLRTDFENLASFSDHREWSTLGRHSYLLMSGYDYSSPMHYTHYHGTNNRGRPITALFPEMLKGEHTYYMMKDISNAHKCDELFCGHETLTCENDGYMTYVRDRCQCMCIDGLDPDTGCTTSIDSRCGGIHELSRENRVFTFSSPKEDGIDCNWLIKAPEGETLRLDFEEFNIDCEEKIGIRWIKPGQPHLRFCGDHFYETVQSVYNTIAVSLITSNASYHGFTATATLSSDLCYLASDHGTTYNGNVNFTRWFDPCLPWAEVGHCDYSLANYYKNGGRALLDGNSCRNPDYKTGVSPWCYVNKKCDRNYCDPCLFGYLSDNSSLCAHVQSRGLCYNFPGCARTCGNLSAKKPSPATEVSCGNPPEVMDGVLIESGQSLYSVGSKVTYRCKSSEATRERFCLTSGEWSSMGFVCDYKTTCADFFSSDECQALLTNDRSLCLIKKFATELCPYTCGICAKQDEELCYYASDHGTTYNGKVNFTHLFEPCLPWAEVGHCEYGLASYLRKGGRMMLDGNYCRNPDYASEVKPWCYTSKSCDKNVCDPCLIGDVFDTKKDCAYRKYHGFCNNEIYKDLAYVYCAETCNFTRPEEPTKVSAVSCGDPPEVVDGVLIQGGQAPYSVGSKVTYRCKSSEATSERICLTDGEWSPLGFVCDDGTTCADFYDNCPDMFSRDPWLCEKSDVCAYTCGTCHVVQVSGDVSCGNPPEVVDGVLIEAEQAPYSVGSKVTYRCKSSDATSERFCMTDGEWSPFGFVCGDGTTCADFSDNCPDMVRHNPRQCIESDVCAYTCGTCHVVRMAQQDSSCIVEAPPANAFTWYADTTIQLGRVVNYQCDEGYVKLSGDNIRSCGPGNVLTGRPIECVKDCEHLIDDRNDINKWKQDTWKYLEATKSCYFHMDKLTKNYFDATEYCQSKGCYLATFKTKEEFKMMQQEFRENYDDLRSQDIWIGLAWYSPYNAFLWSDGKPLLGWTNWFQDHQPEVKYPCIMTMTDRFNRKWIDNNCYDQKHFICQCPLDPTCTDTPPTDVTLVTPGSVYIYSNIEYKCTNDDYAIVSGNTSRTCMPGNTLLGSPLRCIPANCPNGPGWHVLESSNTCYKYYKEEVTYGEAYDACVKEGSYLATPKSKEENDIVRKASSYSRVWIGLDDIEEENKFVWQDGETLHGWTEWFENNPNDGYHGQDCAILQGNGQWNDVGCLTKSSYVCQYQQDTSCGVESPTGNITLLNSTATLALGHSAHYQCKDGYGAVSGDTIRTCIPGKRLSGSTLECFKDSPCTVEPPSANVTLLTSRASVHLGEQVEYQCLDDYEVISGDAVRTCAPGSHLLGSPLRCGSADNCPPSWDEKFGKCYGVFQEEVTCDVAEIKCQAYRGGHLLHQNIEEELLLGEQIIEGNWRHTGDWTHQNEYYQYNEIQRKYWTCGHEGNCTHSYLLDNGRQLAPCSEKHAFICEAPLKGDPIEPQISPVFNNKPVPAFIKFKYGAPPGTVVIIEGVTKSSGWFTVDLKGFHWHQLVLMRFKVNMNKREVFRNSYKRRQQFGGQAETDDGFPFRPNSHFKLNITLTDDRYHISVDNVFFTDYMYRHRPPVATERIEINGDVQLTKIYFQ